MKPAMTTIAGCVTLFLAAVTAAHVHPDDIVGELPSERSTAASVPEMEWRETPKVALSVDTIQPTKGHKAVSAADTVFAQTSVATGSGSAEAEAPEPEGTGSAPFLEPEPEGTGSAEAPQASEPLAPPDNTPDPEAVEKDTPFWKNLAAAKAYSILAKDKIQYVLDDNENFMSAGRYFFMGFAGDGFTPDEEKMYNLALRTALHEKEEMLTPPKIDLEDQYRRLMVDIWKNHSAGWGEGSLGPYVLKHVDEGLRGEEGILEVRGAHVYPTNEAFGMTGEDFLGNHGQVAPMEPSTINRVRVPLHEYEAKYAEISNQYYVRFADEEAKLEKLHKDIEPFYPIPNATKAAEEEKVLDELEKLDAETEGKEEDEPAPAPAPMMAQPGEKISLVMEIATGAEEGMASTMLPNVTFVTSTGRRFGPYSFTTPLPPAGDSDIVSFCTEEDAAHVKGIGQVSSVELDAIGEDPWFFAKVKVRVAGAFLPWVNFKAGNWLDAKFTKPDDNEEQDVMHSAKFDLLPAPEEPEAPKEAPKPWTFAIKAKTGDIATGKLSADDMPTFKVVGETGEAEVNFEPAGQGDSNEQSTAIADIGGIQHIVVTAGGAAPWFFTSFEVKLNDGEWTAYGPGRVFLQQGKGDTHGYPSAAELTLTKKLAVCHIKATTGKFKNSATSGKPKVTIMGENGSESFYLTPGAAGETIEEATPVSDTLGKIEKVMLDTTSSSEWEFTEFEVKMNHNEWVPFGSTHQWLDAEPFNENPASYHMMPYGNSLTLHPETESVSVTVKTGAVKAAETKDAPRLVIHGSKGRKVLEFETGAAGKLATTTTKCVDLGKIHSVVLESTGADEWFATSMSIDINNSTNPTSFGPLPLWLVSAGDEGDELYKGAKVTERVKLHPVSHMLGIKATTGVRGQAGTGSFPKITVTGKEGTYTTVFFPGNAGKDKTTMLTTPAIGEITDVKLTATSTDEWFFTDINVKTDEGDWMGFGPTHQWLQAEPFHKDKATYMGHKFGSEISLKPRAYKTVVSVTTAFAYEAESEDPVTMTLQGELGTSSPFELTGLPKQGETKEYEFATVGLGAIQTVKLQANGVDGWAYSKFNIQQGKESKFVEFGPAHQWVVGKKDGEYEGGPKHYSFFHYADTLELTPAVRHFSLRYGTAAVEPHANNQHPRITWIGTKCNNTFVIEKTPEPGETNVEQFFLTDIGKFIGVLLKSSSDDPWLVDHLAYKEILEPDDEDLEHTSLTLDDEYHYLSLNDELNAKQPYIIQEAVAAAGPPPRYLMKEGEWCNVNEEDSGVLSDQLNTNTDVCNAMCDIHKDCVAFGMNGKDCELFSTCTAKPWPAMSETATLYIKVVAEGAPTGSASEEGLLEINSASGSADSGYLPQTAAAAAAMEKAGVSNALIPRTKHDAQKWVELGSTEFISNDPPKTEKELPTPLKAFAVEDAELARPITVGCHCSGKQIEVEPTMTKYVQSEIGSVCAYHLNEDQKPWCYVTAECSGRTLSKFSPLLWAYCPKEDAVVPVAINIKMKAGSADNGQVKVKAIGAEGGASAEILVPSKDVVPGKWTSVYTNVPLSIGEVKHLEMEYSGEEKLSWDDLHVQYAGGFTHSYTRDIEIGGGAGWKKLHHVAPPEPGTAKVEYMVKDAQTTHEIPGCIYTLLTPRLLGIPEDVILGKLEVLKKDLVNAQEAKSEASPEEMQAEVRKVVMSLGGRDLGAGSKFNPVGFAEKKAGSGWTTFKGVAENDDHVMLMFVPGYLFTFDRVKTKGAHSMVKKRTFMAKNMEHGQMLITLSWDQNPHDLDLYVVAPGKHGDTEIGGGKPGEPSPPPAPGISINWMNMGSPDVYPYTVLDADATYGFGPETMSVHKPVTGKYKIHVDCYSCYGEDSFKTFFESDATVRVYDRMGMKKEFKIKDAKDPPSKYWRVADRTCEPPAPLEGEADTKKGFANRDNTWSFDVHSKFTKDVPQ